MSLSTSGQRLTTFFRSHRSWVVAAAIPIPLAILLLALVPSSYADRQPTPNPAVSQGAILNCPRGDLIQVVENAIAFAASVRGAPQSSEAALLKTVQTDFPTLSVRDFRGSEMGTGRGRFEYSRGNAVVLVVDTVKTPSFWEVESYMACNSLMEELRG